MKKKLIDYKQIFARIDISIPILKDLSFKGFPLDVGALYLELDGRNFILEAEDVNYTNENKEIRFDAKLFVSFDTFEKGKENNYDLTIADLTNENLIASIYVSDSDTGIDDAFDFDKASIECVVIVEKKEYQIKVKID
jgi:hypothetical protein